MSSPEHIHPALWRATQLAHSAHRGISTGYAALSAQLPGGGWPVGALIELLTPHAGIGEIRLLQPALAQLDRRHPIALVQPPHVPHLACWQGWRLNPAQLLWVAPERPLDALWAAEQILKHGSCGALLCWLPRVRPESLRRLHLAAQMAETLCFVLRPATAAQQASPAPLRLALSPAPGGLSVHILKRRGPSCTQPLFLVLESAAAHTSATEETIHTSVVQTASVPVGSLSDHASLDRHLSAQPAAGRRTPTMVS
ncbi:translesion DNA synthesis-associated protein ImuA [Bordetella genomosp. 4]|uniref:Cell division protein n=1 Tax=Bordetella genomosp. 4 TaxID=463044 RepID=A0A261U4B3_9BORD|nr:translesion DNA synthesis-associated protein ImuA [Bordetella genomosp. 4]OZI56455.1 cell division protein [Bordetella genomosp. 4]